MFIPTNLNNSDSIEKNLSNFMVQNSKILNISSNQLIKVNTSSLQGLVLEVPVSEGVHLSYIDAFVGEHFFMSSEVLTEDEIDLSFTFTGSLACKVKGSRKELGTSDKLSSVSLFNGAFDLNMNIPKNQKFKFLKLRFTRDSFEEYCKYVDCLLPPPIKAQFENSRVPFAQCTFILPEKLTYVAIAIANEILAGRGSSYLTQELCIDFTRIILSHLDVGFSRINPKKFISYKDIERVREAYYILSQNLAKPPKLIELAHMVGLNDYKLKTGFRQAYGMSVHECLTDLRLEQAESLLKDNKFSVTEAGFAVGYGNLGDFSRAFQKKFGVKPNTVKRRNA